jgi:hypothetical protein
MRCECGYTHENPELVEGHVRRMQLLREEHSPFDDEEDHYLIEEVN